MAEMETNIDYGEIMEIGNIRFIHLINDLLGTFLCRSTGKITIHFLRQVVEWLLEYQTNGKEKIKNIFQCINLRPEYEQLAVFKSLESLLDMKTNKKEIWKEALKSQSISILHYLKETQPESIVDWRKKQIQWIYAKVITSKYATNKIETLEFLRQETKVPTFHNIIRDDVGLSGQYAILNWFQQFFSDPAFPKRELPCFYERVSRLIEVQWIYKLLGPCICKRVHSFSRARNKQRQELLKILEWCFQTKACRFEYRQKGGNCHPDIDRWFIQHGLGKSFSYITGCSSDGCSSEESDWNSEQDNDNDNNDDEEPVTEPDEDSEPDGEEPAVMNYMKKKWDIGNDDD